jgi:hypothetical protein
MYLPRYSLQSNEDAVLNTSSVTVEDLLCFRKWMVTNIIGVYVIRCGIFIGLEQKSIF